jgi:photosystem II stability/assembly factor-like uncharacterized protein
MGLIVSKPDEDLRIAGVATAGLWGTRDGGKSWSLLGEGEGSVPVVNGTNGIIFDPEDADTFWEVGAYGIGGIYKTEDGGDTFSQVGTIFHNDYLGIDFTDPERKTLVASGHEQGHLFHRSTDGGDTWVKMGEGIPSAAKSCSYPYVVDSETFLFGCGGNISEGSPGIFRSTDAGESFTRVSVDGGATAPLVTRDGTLYWPSENGGGLAVSRDNGLSWVRAVGAGVLLSIRPIELPDGRLVSANSEQVLISADEGKKWRPITVRMPFTPIGVAYSADHKALFIWHNDCGQTVPEDAILRHDFDYETQ